METLTAEAIQAGFYNIDVDTSTLVDLSKPGLEAQQQQNGEVCAELTGFIREHEPRGVTISVGGEIGEVGGKNSTPEEFEAFMSVYATALARARPGPAASARSRSRPARRTAACRSPTGRSRACRSISKRSRRSRSSRARATAWAERCSTARPPFPPSCSIVSQGGHARDPSRHRVQSMLFDHPSFPTDLKREIYESSARWRRTSASRRTPTSSSSTRLARRRWVPSSAPCGRCRPVCARRSARRSRPSSRSCSSVSGAVGTRGLAEKHAPFVPGSFPVLGG